MSLLFIGDMFAITLIFVLALASDIGASEIICEKVANYEVFEKCCYLNKATVISDPNVTFSGSEIYDVNAILLLENYNIEYLPVNISKNVPNLEFYLAGRTIIREISALNFAKLSNLKFLGLQNNKIEFIPNNCFQDLTKIQEIDLSTQNNIAA